MRPSARDWPFPTACIRSNLPKIRRTGATSPGSGSANIRCPARSPCWWPARPRATRMPTIASNSCEWARRSEKTLHPNALTMKHEPNDSAVSHPLGASLRSGGANFSLFSRSASRVELLFFDQADDARPSRIIELDPHTQRTYHYWHVFVPGVKAGQLYGYRVHGPSDPARGMRFDPAKVLLDPYGRGVVVPPQVQPRSRRPARRQRRHGDEKRGGGPERLRLGRRHAAAPALLADDHLRNARARFHPPSQLRRGGGQARHLLPA